MAKKVKAKRPKTNAIVHILIDGGDRAKVVKMAKAHGGQDIDTYRDGYGQELICSTLPSRKIMSRGIIASGGWIWTTLLLFTTYNQNN